MNAPIYVNARWLPYYVSPDDVRAKKGRIDATIQGLDVAIAACPAITEVDRKRWALFLTGWATFRDEPVTFFDSAAPNEHADAYEQDVRAWADWLSRQPCGATSTAPSMSTWGESHDDGGPAGKQTKSMIQTVAIAGAVIAVALGLRAAVSK